jgi:hypothetical protein
MRLDITSHRLEKNKVVFKQINVKCFGNVIYYFDICIIN